MRPDDAATGREADETARGAGDRVPRPDERPYGPSAEAPGPDAPGTPGEPRDG